MSAEGDETVDHKFQHNAVFNLFLRADDNRDKIWTAGEKIVIIARFQREVVVSTSGGAPTIGLEIGDGRGSSRVRRALYARVSNEDQSAGLYTDLVFEYPVRAADGEVRDVRVPANSLRRDGAAIRDRRGYDAALGHGEKEWSTQTPPLGARFAWQPERHDGKKRIKIRVEFSEPPDNVDEHSVSVEGGRVKSVRPVGGNAPDGAGTRSVRGADAGRQDREVVWEFEIEPDTDGDVTVTLEANRPCEEPGAICTADGRSLSEGISTTVEGPEAGPPPLTASFTGLPEAHDGESAFRFRLAFSEPIAISYRSLREDAFVVTGGRVTRGKRVDGRKDLFEITVEPDGAGDVALSLPAGRDCEVSGAICTWGPPRKRLTNTPAARVAGPAVETGPLPLTASLVNVPAEHDGDSGFTLRIAFSETIRMSGRRLRSDVVAVAGGRATKARSVNGRKDLWKLTVRPDSLADVTVTLAAGAACDTPGAVCTADGRALSNTISATVEGPVAVSVADARAREGEDETIDFAVSLSRAASGRVSVSYATADGTATAGSDYTRASGKLRFAPGETEKTISVPVLDDAHDEGEETLTLRLTAATGARITDGEATGTIENTDHMPQAWLARFGRSAATHVLDAVEARLQGGGSETWVQLGGHRIGGGAASEALARLAPQPRLWDEVAEADPAGRDVTVDQLLLGSSFHLASNKDADALGPRLSAWGRVASSGFDGVAGDTAFDGTVTTAMLGVEGVFERWLTGLALAHSVGDGAYTLGAVDAARLDGRLTSLHPYVAYELSDRVTVWGLVGYGSGTLELVREAERLHTDLEMTMGALGVRGEVLGGRQGGGLALAIRSDVLWTRMQSAALADLAATEAAVSRLRLVLEGSRTVRLTGGGSLTPVVEIGLRHDGGDAETGSGVEAGARLLYASAWGLSVEASVRGLLAHEAADYREWGVGGALRFDPGQQGRGLTASILPTWGSTASGVERLWGQPNAAGLAVDNAAAGRLDAELGYGLSALQGRGLLTPYVRAALVEGDSRAWHLGARLALAASLNFSVEASRRQRDGDAAAHELALLATLAW